MCIRDSRHLYRVDRAGLGNFKISPCTGYLDREDDFASSGCRGLADFVVAVFKCVESQARGFAHGHGKIHSSPGPMDGLMECLEKVARFAIDAKDAEKGRGRDSHMQKQQSDADPRGSERSAGDPCAQPDDVCRAVEHEVEKMIKACNASVLDSARSRQYESSILPAKQFGNSLPDPPFSVKQQRQSRYDGLFEDCLLYTSPSPRDATLSRMPSSA